MPRSYLLFLEDMQEAMERVARYIADVADFEAFNVNELVRDAVVRNLEIIGEAAKKVPPTVQQAHPQVPWSQMYRMRNRITHEYFGLDYLTIWKVITEYLPLNYEQVKQVLAAERSQV